MDIVRAAFRPDVFADPPIAPEVLAQHEQQALALFQAAAPIPPGCSPQVQQAVTQAQAHYHKCMTAEEKRLRRGLDAAAQAMDQAYARIIQLLAEWAALAQEQATRAAHSTPVTGLHTNSLLLLLRTDEAWAQHVRQLGADWQHAPHLVEEWYQQLVKRHLRGLKKQPSPKQLLAGLVEKVVFGEESILSHFSELDTSWFMHWPLVKRLVRTALSEKDINLSKLSVTADWDQVQRFYTDLVTTTRAKDQELETLIATKIKNWTTDRLVLTDKTIIKLALCEMLYFDDIPVKVSIDEYIHLAKTYSTAKSSTFVNGLLDAMAADA